MFGRVTSILLGTAMLLALSTAAMAGPAAERTYGKGVSDPGDLVAISELLSNPDQYIDKTVRVSGSVVGVCKKRGCWMELASDQEFQSLQIKVEDGEIIFPMEMMGETAVAEGVFVGIPLTMEQTCNYMEHEAQCQGEKFDKASIKGPMTLYRIAGTGAIMVPSKADADEPAADAADSADHKS